MYINPLSLTVTACVLLLVTAFCSEIAMAQTAAQSDISQTAAEYGLGRPRAESPQARQTPAPRSEGWWQAFERGWVYWHPRHRAHLVRGRIFETWGGQRWEQGPLGFPTRGESECRSPDSRDRYQVFEGGRVYWRAATNETIVFNNPTNFGEGGNCNPAAATLRGRFRVTLTGFTCHHETVDHPLELDGKRDEVYIDSHIWTIERTRGVVSHTNRRSAVMGDTNFSANPRARAGSASDRGGIKTGDNVPNSPPWSLSGAKLEDDRLPMRLWEGELVQGANGAENAAVIMPTIWEWDGFDELARQWDSLVNSHHRIRNPIDGLIDQPLINVGILFGGYSYADAYSDVPITLSGAADRPIGLSFSPDRRPGYRVPGGYMFSPQSLLLTYRMAEEAINHPYTNNGAGVIKIRYSEARDDRNTGGDYSLFFLIERLP